jgi:tRNA modification GTPase
MSAKGQPRAAEETAAEPAEQLNAVLMTAPGRSAVATVRVTGSGVHDLLRDCFVSASQTTSTDMRIGRVYFGTWTSGATTAGTRTGEELVLVPIASNEFEIHGHGGKMASERILKDVRDRGGQRVASDQWLMRNTASRLAAEAQLAVAQAATDLAAAHLLAQQRGALEEQLKHVIERLDSSTDFSDRHIMELLGELQAVGQVGTHLIVPFQLVVAGPPNVGKSLLINRLLGYDRAIVFDRPGTTRDVLKTVTAWNGWLFELSDTAGVRDDAEDAIERAGIERARQAVQDADVILSVRDASDLQETPFPHPPDKTIEVLNKCDLCSAVPPVDEAIPISALTMAGIGDVVAEIMSRLLQPAISVGAAIPFLPRHLALLDDAQASITAGDRVACRAALVDLIGMSDSTRESAI